MSRSPFNNTVVVAVVTVVAVVVVVVVDVIFQIRARLVESTFRKISPLLRSIGQKTDM